MLGIAPRDELRHPERDGYDATTISRTFRRASVLFSRDWRRPHWRILYFHDVPRKHREVFAAQLDLFSRQFTWCTITEGTKALVEGTIDRPMMSLTFDDADRTVHDIAMPILGDRNIKACCYAVPDYVERGDSYRDDVPRPIMSWMDLRDWLAAGHEIGSHTYTHAALPRCSAKRFEQEISWSQDTLQQKLCVSVRHFAYPWGQYDIGCGRDIAATSRYDSVATTHRGPMTCGHDVYALRRDRGELTMSHERMEILMRMADRFYWLRRLRPRRIKSYWQQHRDETWEELPCPPQALNDQSSAQGELTS